ncbi:MAG: transglutaminase domain-containing protein [Burkholderiales bacterium]
MGESEEFVGLRDYRPGDPLQQVHWEELRAHRAADRKEHQDEFFERHALVLDTSTDRGEDAAFEEAVALAASFVYAIDTQECLLDLLFVGREVHGYTTGRGQMRAEHLLEVLAGVAPSAPAAFEALANRVRGHRHRLTSCIVVLLEWDAARRAFVEGLRASGLEVRALLVCARGARRAAGRAAYAASRRDGSGTGEARMNLPRGLLGAGLLFWGSQTDYLLVGAVLAALVEAPRWSTVRFELRPADLARIADLCTLIFIGVVVVVAASRGFRDGLLGALQWLPAVLAPIVLAQLASSAGRIPLSALFQVVRRRKRRDPSAADPLVDLSGVYLAVCAIAAGVANLREPSYYAGTVLLASWALLAARPAHARLGAWLGALALAAAAGYVGQAGLGQLQASLEDWAAEWNLRGMDADPYRSSTDIGSIGRLKTLDTIVLRVYADPQAAAKLKLLHRASFTTYAGTTWHARKAPMAPVAAQPDGATWVLADGTPDSSVRIVTRLENGKALLALPGDTVRIAELNATEVKRNALGAVQADVGGDWARYVAVRSDGFVGGAPPGEEDVTLPAAERAAIEALAAELELRGVPAGEAVRRVARHFGAFSYSTYREASAPRGTTALADFLQRSKSGHCEYFAAATTLLLRAGGIPARYSTGFAMLEYSELEGAYVVRARHAHAWTRVWVGDRWVDVDTTPPIWFAEEARLAPAWQKLADFFRWASYRWAQRTGFEAGEGWLGLLGVLIAVLGWRIVRGKRARRPSAHQTTSAERTIPGLDSEFYDVEHALARRGISRTAGETLTAWSSRALATMDELSRKQFEHTLQLHLRYRFDPADLPADDRETLRYLVRSLTSHLTVERPTNKRSRHLP